MRREQKEDLGSWTMFLTLSLAILIGLGLFVALPHGISAYLGTISPFRFGVESLTFHILDGLIKVFIFIAYIWIISRFKEIRRIFQYHGAEHKSIFTYESGEDLTVENAMRHSTLHPRCGTSFILLVLIISILLFSFLFPFLPKFAGLSVWVKNGFYVFFKILLMIPITGLAYEAIKYSGKKAHLPWVRVMILPGLWIQHLTTQEPTEDQIEVALQALSRVLSSGRAARRIRRLFKLPTMMLEKLEEVEGRFAKVEESLGDGEILRNQAAYQKLAKEHSDLAPLIGQVPPT